MAVGRISGPLLAKNLLRDGVDLAFETSLLYLNVRDGRIGINTSTFAINPTNFYEENIRLDVNGTGRFKYLIVQSTSTFAGPINAINPTNAEGFYSTITNTASVAIAGGVTIAKDVWIAGTLHVNSVTTFSSTATFQQILNITSTTNSVSTDTGALVVAGGVGIGRDVNIGGSLSVTATTQLYSSLDVVSTSTFHDVVNVTTTASSTDSTTGALVVAGGVGIGENLNIAGALTVNSSAVFNNTLQAASTATFNNIVNITTTTNSVSTDTGAFVVAGGVGIGRDVNIGGLTTIFGKLTVNADTAINGSLSVQYVSTLGNVTVAGSSITNGVGNFTISSPKDTTIVLNNNTLVQGNLHATGNITAEGSVQIGNQTGSDTLSLFADIISNITPQTSNTYNIGAPDQTWANGYFESLVTSNLLAPPGQQINIGARPPQDVNVAPITNPRINLNGPVRIWGDNPLGTAPVTSNVLYVSMDGSDTNDGRAADPSRACRTIKGATKSPYYKEGTSIKVAAGRYYEDNPIELKPLTSVIGSDLRTTFIEPINKTQDLFWVKSGNYLAQMQFSNGQSGLLPGTGYNAGSNRGAYAVAFKPNYGGEKIDVFHSPYIQNCTNQAGPWLWDGTMFIPNQTVQIPEAVGEATWSPNTTTMVVVASEGVPQVGQTINVGPTPIDYVNARTLLLANKPFIQEQVIAYIDQTYSYYGYDKTKCIRDTGLIVDSLIADLIFPANGYTQSNFAGLQYWNQDGYTGSIAAELTTTTNAINYVSFISQQIVQNILVDANQSRASQDTGIPAGTVIEANYIGTDFSIITDILTNGTAHVTDIIVPNGSNVVSLDAQRAFNLLQLNKTFIQEQAIAYINDNNPGFDYDQTKCYRDVGYMVDSISFDLLYGGNRQAIQSGVYYYGFSNTASAIPTERPQTTAAYYRIRDIVGEIIQNQLIIKSAGNLTNQNTSLPASTSAPTTALQQMVDKITEIINAGPNVADAATPIGFAKTSDANVLKAAAILEANKTFITSEVINYIDQTYNNGFIYNQPKCARDTGLIVDSIATDLLYGGYTQSNFAGLQYWNQNGYTGQITSELSTTTEAIFFVSSLAQKVILNTTGTSYQTSSTQVFGTPATSSQAKIVSNEFTIITDILTNGTGGVTDIIVPNGLATSDTNVVNAYTSLQANKSYIQAEAVAYVNSLNASFNQVKCARDTGLIIDAIAQDLLFGGTSQSKFAALSYWNQTGYTGLIGSEVTTTTNAINYVKSLAKKAVVGDTSGIRYTGGTQITNLPIATYAEAAVVGDDFDVVTNIITNGTAGVTDIIVPNRLIASTSTNVQHAYALLEANKAYLQAEAVAYVEATKTPEFAYTTSTCYRDVGYIIDSVAFDLLYGGNRQAVQSGVYYYTFDGTSTAIPNETRFTVDAYNYLKSILPYIIEGQAVPTTHQFNINQSTSGGTGNAAQVSIAQSEVDVITNIILNGPDVAGDKTPIGQTSNINPAVINAATQIENNRAFIVAEVLAYINTQNVFQYDEAKCYRDVGYMVDSVSFDLLHGGNRQAVQSGVYYYSWNSNSTAIPNEIPQTTAAYNHIRNIVGSIATGQTITPTNGNTVAQITGTNVATNLEVTNLYNNIDVITNIINNGPAVADAGTPIPLEANTSTTVVAAYDLLLANKEFIKAETIAYINQFATGFVYNRAKCARDVGIIVENIAYDVAFGGNEKTREAGLAYWNGVASVIPGEIPETINAFSYLGTIAKDIVANTTTTNLLNAYQTQSQVINTVLVGGESAQPLIDKLVSLINDVLTNGPEAAPPLQIGNGPDWGSVSAEVLLQANRKFIQKEVVDWVNAVFPDFDYNEELCYRDTGLIVDAISQDIVLNSNEKTIEAAVTYWTGNENVLANAQFGTKDQVQQTVAAIEHAKQVALSVINNTTASTTGFVFNSFKCSRDTGLIVDALAQDLLFDGNSQSTFAGIQYWNHGDYVGNITNEITTTTAAINYLSDLAQKIIANDISGPRYQNTVTQVIVLPGGTSAEITAVRHDFDVILNILSNGTANVTNNIVPNNINPNSNFNVQNSYSLLQANKDYFKAEVIAWIETNMNFRYDQVKCARDTGLIIDSMVLDLAYPTNSYSQSTFAALSYWNQNGYTGLIQQELTTTTNAINYISELAQKIIVNDTSGVRYQSILTQITGAPATSSEVATIAQDFLLVTDILTNGTAGVTDQIISNNITPSSEPTVNNAYSLLQTNKEYLQAEAVAYVEANKSEGFEYTTSTCYRDVGYIIDSISFDLLHGGNRQAIQSGVYYYTFDGTSSSIPNEIPETVAAYEYLKVISGQVAQNIAVTPLQNNIQQLLFLLPPAGEPALNEINNEATRIISILENGPDIVGVKEPISLVQTTDVDKLNAVNNLVANKEFIKAQVIAYVNGRLSFQYDRAKCARDVGYMVDSLSFDLLYGGNRQAIQSGVYYWGYSNVSTSLPNERSASTQAYQYMKAVISNVVLGTPLTRLYQNTVPQVTNLPKATQVEANAITANIDLITTIINAGPSAAPEATNISLERNPNEFVNNAATLLEANRDFIRAEVIAFVQSTVNDQVFLPFYDLGANATLSVVRNFDIIENVITNGVQSAPSLFAGNGIFVTSGLSVNDVKIAPVVTSVAPLGGNTYRINISESTVGYGDNQTLYFGQTAVYPLLDLDVPNRWQQRRINPHGSIGGALIDGAVVSERSPINSFVFDAYTQLNQGGQGVKITNNGYAQLVSVFTIFCSNAVTVENGGICSITNSNSNFGDICLTAKGYGKREFSGYVKNAPVLPYYPNGVYPQGGEVVVYIADPQLRPHIGLVLEVQPPVGYTNYQGYPGFLSGNTNVGVLTTGTINITGVDNTGFCIGQAFYVRDQYGRQVDVNNQPYVRAGTIVSDVGYQSITLNYPLNSGGGDPNNANYFNLYSCGNAYYTVLSSTIATDPVEPGTFLLPGLQGTAEINALNYLNSLTQKIILNQPVTPLQTSTVQVFDPTLAHGSEAGIYIQNEVNIINSILANGPSSAPTVVKNGTVPAGTGYADAAGLLNINKSFLQDEIIKYVDENFLVFIYDQDKCYRDTGLIVDAVAQDLVFGGISQSTFAGVQYWNQSNYVGAIASEITTTTNAINFTKLLAEKVVQNIVPDVQYQTTVTQVTNLPPATSVEAKTLGVDFDVVLDILFNGTAHVTDKIVPNSLTASGNLNVQRAYEILQANKEYIQAETVAYVDATKTPGFAYDSAKCYRDVGYMVDSVGIDLLYGGNRQAVQSGVYYYGYNSASTAIPNEIPQTTAAYNHIKQILPQIIEGIPVTTYQTAVAQVTATTTSTAGVAVIAQANINVITTIINGGPSVASEPTSLPITPSVDLNILAGGDILEANREFIQAETVAFINHTFGQTFTYNTNKCARDTGLIVDALAQDLLFSTSSQATFAGLQYWNQDGYTGIINSELTTTTNAIAYVSDLVQKIIVNDTSGIRYSASSQITGLGGTQSEVDTVATDFALIIDILNNGTIGVTERIVPNKLTASININIEQAYALIQANKTYIQEEAVAFVEATKDVDFVYDQALCYRDVGYMVDSVSFDLLYTGNRQAVQSGVYYFNFNGGSTAIPNEIPETTAAYNHIKSISQQIILGQIVKAYQTVEPQVLDLPTGTAAEAAIVQADVDVITNIINTGPSAVLDKTPISLNRSTDANVINAALLLETNREFIKAETIAYINRVFGAYNKDTCRRDVGLVVDALVYDLARGGNYNAIVAGKSYYATHGTHHLVQLEESVTDPALFPDGAITTFYQRSYMSASGYLFEYVGAGSNYGALPQVGVADPIQSKETVQLNNGKVFFTSTDQNGDFRIGTGLVISQATGVLSGRTFTKSLFANLTPFILAIEGI